MRSERCHRGSQLIWVMAFCLFRFPTRRFINGRLVPVHRARLAFYSLNYEYLEEEKSRRKSQGGDYRDETRQETILLSPILYFTLSTLNAVPLADKAVQPVAP